MKHNANVACRMPRSRKLLRIGVLFLLALISPYSGFVVADEQQLVADERVEVSDKLTTEQLTFVQNQVHPLLVARCGECHGPSVEVKGGLSLASRQTMLRGGESGPAIVPYQVEKSLLISAVKYESFEMPPRSRMPDEEIRILERWIEAGAPWPDDALLTDQNVSQHPAAEFPLAERKESHWAWQTISNPPPPAVANQDWCRQPVDQFIQESLNAAGLRAAADADRRAILRRLYFDLIGLPPTIAQQEAFLNDPADDDVAIARVADQLLASPHFGERWARHWLDLVRYAESLGHEFDYPLPNAWKYRDYVIRAFNLDVPYRQMIVEHIAGDLLPEPRRHVQNGFNESVIGTGFWFLGEDKHAPVDVKGEEAARIDNQIDVFSRAFFGMTVACARCHDHKFDAITAADYYALSGFLQSSRRRTEWLDTDGQLSHRLQEISGHRAALQQIVSRDADLCTDEAVTARLTELLLSGGMLDHEQDGNATIASDKGHDTELRDPLSLFHTVARSMSTADAAIAPATAASASSVQRGDAGPAELPQSTSSAARRWAGRIQQQHTTRNDGRTELFAEFYDDLPANWLTYGRAFQPENPERQTADRVTQSPIRWTSDGLTLQDDAAVSSADLAGLLPGTLQSPTFKLQHPEILVLAAGQNARMRLVIDGYVMNEFSELLFRGARQPIDTNGKFQWIRLGEDVQRYLGHQCHLEFLDDGDGWFAIREIRFALQPGAQPPAGAAPSVFNRSMAEFILASEDDHPSRWLTEFSQRLKQDRSWPDVASRLGLLPTWSTDSSADYTVSASDRGNTSQEQDTVQQHRIAWQQAAERLPQGDPVLVMCDGSGEDEHLFIRGSHRNPGEVVPRRFLTALASAGDGSNPESSGYISDGSGRLRLARDVVSDQNPLTARVAVNRIWKQLFGQGLVASVDNFGVLGNSPSHPELLDHLATRFQQQGWSVKKMIRYLVTSRAYRQSVVGDPASSQLDPTNTLLHRANVRRLEGEVIRDAMLAVSGRLQPVVYGPSVPVHLTEFMQGRGRPTSSGPLDGDGRRSIYQTVRRNFLSPVMLAFDTPAPATTVGRRGTSNVPAQALILLNNEFVIQQARVWAQRLLSPASEAGINNPGTRSDAILTQAFLEAFCRDCSTEERRLLLQFAQDQAAELGIPAESALTNEDVLTDVCHVLLNQKEFLFLD